MPENDNLIADFEEEVLPSVTWKVDFERNLVTTNITDMESVRQASLLTLGCERYEYIIYSDQYGVELVDLIGESQDYAMAEIKRRITDALMYDDRVTSVTNFEFTRTKRALHVTFTVTCDVGTFDAETEVLL